MKTKKFISLLASSIFIMSACSDNTTDETDETDGKSGDTITSTTCPKNFASIEVETLDSEGNFVIGNFKDLQYTDDGRIKTITTKVTNTAGLNNVRVENYYYSADQLQQIVTEDFSDEELSNKLAETSVSYQYENGRLNHATTTTPGGRGEVQFNNNDNNQVKTITHNSYLVATDELTTSLTRTLFYKDGIVELVSDNSK